MVVLRGGYGVPFRVPLQGSIGVFRVLGLGVVISGVISRVTIVFTI